MMIGSNQKVTITQQDSLIKNYLDDYHPIF